jgi:hypothetical protein
MAFGSEEATKAPACGARERLSTALVPETLPTCHGERPWLGRSGTEGCTEKLRLLVRSASNAYFGQEVSALSLAESSCERFNGYLDRSLVVPTLGHPPGLAFFDLRQETAPTRTG